MKQTTAGRTSSQRPPGEEYILPDGTRISVRDASSSGGRTIDTGTEEGREGSPEGDMNDSRHLEDAKKDFLVSGVTDRVRLDEAQSLARYSTGSDDRHVRRNFSSGFLGALVMTPPCR